MKSSVGAADLGLKRVWMVIQERYTITFGHQFDVISEALERNYCFSNRKKVKL
jgi:hypothetical protein